jgi:hypothetical protein
MPEYVGMSEPTIDDRFLDQVLDVAARAREMVGQLKHLPATTREQLFSADVSVARRAALELVRAYFQAEQVDD